VHGIYGSDETFRNEETKFDWPSNFPRKIAEQDVDVYQLNYQTQLIAWATDTNPSFSNLAGSVFEVLKPLRVRGYNSVSYIAHSLGGNVISTYIHSVKTTRGDAARSQNGFVITLATPVLGSQIANIGAALKQRLGMRDHLLNALKRGNLYLEM